MQLQMLNSLSLSTTIRTYTADEDVLITRKLRMCGKIFNINVVDHITIGFSDHVRLKDQELM